jgi:hypothetical protein
MNGQEDNLPVIDFGPLDWRPIAEYGPTSIRTPLLLDGAGRVVVGIQDENGQWRDVRDPRSLQIQFQPVQWAIPSAELIEALTYG